MTLQYKWFSYIKTPLQLQIWESLSPPYLSVDFKDWKYFQLDYIDNDQIFIMFDINFILDLILIHIHNETMAVVTVAVTVMSAWASSNGTTWEQYTPCVLSNAELSSSAHYYKQNQMVGRNLQIVVHKWAVMVKP